MENTSSGFLWPFMLQLKLQTLLYKTLLFPWWRPWCFSLFLLLLLSLDRFFFFSSKAHPPTPLNFPLLYKPHSYSNFYSCYTTGLVFKDIFLTLLDSSPSLSLNSAFSEIFLLFRLSYMNLMQHRLGEGSQIEVEIKIFDLLACSGSFPQFLVPFGGSMWIICATDWAHGYPSILFTGVTIPWHSPSQA